MAQPEPRAVLVLVSQSFVDSMRAFLEDARFRLEERAPDHDGPLPPNVACFVLAGGAEPDGLDWIERHRDASDPIYCIGANADHRVALGAVARGARDYFALPGDLDLLRRTLDRLSREARAGIGAEQFACAERQALGLDTIIGRSPPLQAILSHATRVAAVKEVTVLLGGETGTGKELLARAIHFHSPRARAPFVEINCAAIPATLLESELFGHERGAFTGAIAAKPGLFELADGGTVFLDEIGHLPLDLQPKLLRALESREVRRVGGQAAKHFDVRVIGATHMDLAQAVASGTFREDLFYRLNVVHLVLPPLRDRGADVELLAEAFVTRLAAQHELPAPLITAEIRAALRAHPWPGNIRELRNAIERALVLSPPGQLDLAELLLPRPVRAVAGGLPFPAPLGTIIRAAALQTLERVDGNKSEAARRLGISRPRLQRILDGDTE